MLWAGVVCFLHRCSLCVCELVFLTFSEPTLIVCLSSYSSYWWCVFWLCIGYSVYIVWHWIDVGGPVTEWQFCVSYPCGSICWVLVVVVVVLPRWQSALMCVFRELLCGFRWACYWCAGYHLPVCWLSVTGMSVIGYWHVGYHLMLCRLSLTGVLVITYCCAGYHLLVCWLSVTGVSAISYWCAGYQLLVLFIGYWCAWFHLLECLLSVTVITFWCVGYWCAGYHFWCVGYWLLVCPLSFTGVLVIGH